MLRMDGERDYHGEKRSNDTHTSTMDPDAKLYRKGNGRAAKLSYMGHALMENRSGLIVQAVLTQASGTAERGRCHRHARPACARRAPPDAGSR